MKTYEKYLTERKPTSHDYEIKDMALDLSGEIESSIEEIIHSWMDEDSWTFKNGEEIDKNDTMKVLNLAIKKINIKKLDI